MHNLLVNIIPLTSYITDSTVCLQSVHTVEAESSKTSVDAECRRWRIGVGLLPCPLAGESPYPLPPSTLASLDTFLSLP